MTYVSNATTRPLTGKIYSTPALRSAYLQTLCQLYNGYFSTTILNPKVDSIADVIRPYVYADPKKMYTNTQFENNINNDIFVGTQRIPGIKSFITARQNSVQTQLTNLGVTCDLPATPFVKWTFEDEPMPGGDSTPLPTLGTGNASIVGSMTNPSRGTGSFNGCTQTSGSGSWHIGTANPGAEENSSGAQFMVSTIGYSNITFEYDHRFSGQSTRTVRIQYTTDGGSSWINFHATPSEYFNYCIDRGGLDDGKIDVTDPIGNNVSDSWSRRTISFIGLSGIENNPDFGVRVVAAHYDNTGQFRQSNNVNNPATAGTWRFDNVTFSGTPILTSIPESEITAYEFKLSQNYPNPFNPRTKIEFAIPSQTLVRLSVYDITGRQVALLVNEIKQAGNYLMEFSGENLSSGVYFYKMEAGEFRQVKRMLLIK